MSRIPRMSREVRGRAAWLFLAAVVLLYGPMAIEYMWPFFGFDGPGLWISLYSGVVGAEQATAAGSVVTEQHQQYEHSRVALLIHTVGGGLAIALAIAQFHRGLRTRFSRVHRLLGRAQVTIVVASMVTAIAYLVRTGPDRVFDGPAFYTQLFFLAFATLASSLLAVIAVRRRQIAVHQALMAYNFALLLTAPLLRVQYLALGVNRDTTQEVTNMQGAVLLGFIAVTGAIVASRYFDRRSAVPVTAPVLPGRVLDRAAAATCLSALAAIVVVYRVLFGGIDEIILFLALAYAVFSAGFLLTGRSARQRGHLTAAYDWRIHTLALYAAPPLLLLYTLILAVPFTPTQAFYGAALTAPATTLTLGLLFVIWTRRVTHSPKTAPRQRGSRRDHADIGTHSDNAVPAATATA